MGLYRIRDIALAIGCLLPIEGLRKFPEEVANVMLLASVNAPARRISEAAGLMEDRSKANSSSELELVQ